MIEQRARELAFRREEHGFWRQEDPRPFQYTESYKSVQGTTPEMSWCRLGFLLSAVDPVEARGWSVCDVGSGNGCFAREASKFFHKGVKEYDLSGKSISREELEGTDWDLVFLTDVLEHFHDIQDLFSIKFKLGFFSFPETPLVEDWRELKDWRHFKPDEHVWCLNMAGAAKWFKEHGYSVVASGHPEDSIRRPQPGLAHNISTLVVKRVCG